MSSRQQNTIKCIYIYFGPFDWRFHELLAHETFPIVKLDNHGEDSQPSVTIHPHWPGPEHPDTLIIFSNFADSLEAQSRHTEAEEHYREVLTIRAGVLGSEHNDTLRTARELARCLHAQGKKTEALEFARLAANGWQKTLGAEHPRTLLALELVRSIEKP